ncbi:hypothetical protein, conserved [Leishmania lindenbergi]|uniref:Uncharacterized protein n=1 Tax=Leishmania lindenbergi TaxID=651832 RepID=A0AAW3AKY0_9TRYP
MRHDRSGGGVPAGGSVLDGEDVVGAGGGLHSTHADFATTLVTEADGDLLVSPLMHFLEDEEMLRYVAGLLDRRRLDEVASAVEAFEHTLAGDLSGPSNGLSRAVILQRDYVLSAHQSRSLHVLMRSSSGAQSTMCRHRAYASTPVFAGAVTGCAMVGAVAGSDVRISAQGRDCSRAVPHGSHLHSGGDKETAAAAMRSANPGNIDTGSPTSSTAATASSLYLTTLTTPLCDTGGGGVYLSCTGSGDAAMTHQSAAQQRSGPLRSSLDAAGPGGSASAAAAALQGMEVGPEGHTASTAEAAVASAPPPIDLRGFCLAVRHNVFANYRTLPVHCAQRFYEQLPVRYRAGLDAISAEVLQQQQQRDQQQGSTDVVSASDGAANIAAATSIGGGGTASVSHPRSRRTEGSSAGMPAASPGATGHVAEGYHDPVTFIGMGYYGTGGRGGGWPTTMNLSGSIGATSTSTTPAVSPGWLSSGGSMRPDTTVFPSLPLRAMEERAAAAMAFPGSATTIPTARDAAAAGLPVPSLPSSSPTSAVTTTSATVYDAAAGTGLVSRVALLHHVQHTIQAFIARGERDVALHYIMATAPYRFPGMTDSDRVLALFNQIRLFLPSPRFSIVMLAMEAWRSLYRPSVGAGAADYTHMTHELLALIETYLCYGRTYAEYVSGLLMLRAVLALAMENNTLYNLTAAVLLQHRSLLQGRLPTFLLAVWLILMEFYTIDDTVLPPRRVLRDLAANAMQDLFTVALELHMALLVQNVIANAVNIFFAGPQPQPQLCLSPLIPVWTGEAAVSPEVSHHSGAKVSNNSSSSLLNLNTTATLQPPHRLPGAGAASVATTACVSVDPTETSLSALRTVATTSASPAVRAPTSSYRTTAKSMWSSVKRAARRLAHSTLVTSLSPALATIATVDGRRDAVEAAGATCNGLGGASGGPFAPPASDLPGGTASGRPLATHSRPSPPLLIEVVDDLFCESMETDSVEHAEAAVRLMGSGSQHVQLSTASTAAGGHGLAQSSSSPSSQIALQAAVTIATAGGGCATMSSPLHALRQPSATSSPLLHPASWAQRRHQRRNFSAAAAAATTLGLESPSAFSDVLWDDVPLDGAILSRDALWTLPLARALRAAGRPQTLEATVAASTLTLGAFLCAWRIAGFSEETASDQVGSHALRQSNATTTVTEASLSSNPAEASTLPSGVAPIPRHIDLASCGIGLGDADPFTEGVVLPLLTLDSLVTVADSGVQAGRRDSLAEPASLPHLPPVAGGSAAMPCGVSAASGAIGASTGDLDKSVSMLSATMAALATRTGAPRRRGMLLASTATDADPEWQSVESAATNVFVPPVAGVAPSLSVASGTATRAAGGEVSTATPALVTDTTTLLAVSPLLGPRAGPSLYVGHAPSATAAAGGSDGDHTSAGGVTPPGVSRAASTVAPTPDSVFFHDSHWMGGGMQGAASLAASATASRRQSGLPATMPTPTTESCRARVSPTAVADISATDRSDPLVGARGCDNTPLVPMAAPTPAVSSGTANVQLYAEGAAAQTPSLNFFLPSWVAARVLERCVRPCWDAAGSTALSSTPDGARGATRHTGSVAVSKEAEVLLTSVVPLLSQYYVGALSASVVTVATQVLVNRAIQAVKSLSQELLDGSYRLGANSHGGAPTEATSNANLGTPPPSSSASLKCDVAPRSLHIGGSLHGPELPAASPQVAASTATTAAVATTTTPLTPCAPPFSAWQAEDSARMDGTELLNAVLFTTTVAGRYPAVYERIVRQRLYPLLHRTLLLHNSAVEEPQLWLSMPLSSAAVGAYFNGGARAAAVQSLVPQRQRSSSLPLSPVATAAVEDEAIIQRMRLITARSMYQRLAMPALVLLSHNMPDDACARRCYPLVLRLAQLGLRRPFSMASVTTALCICAVYPPLSRVCQSELARAMAVVLTAPDDGLSDGDNDGADNATARTASRETEAGGVRQAHYSRRGPPQAQPEEVQRGTREEGVVTSKPAEATRGAAQSPTSLPVSAAAAASQGLLPCFSSRRAAGGAAHPMWRSPMNFQLFFPFSSTNVGQLRLPAASVRAARRRQAVQTRLIKYHCFRAMSLFSSSWEGTTLFFLEVCLPYLRHPDAQLRLACMQCCMRWLLSDCWRSPNQAVLHHHAATPAVSAGDIAAAPSTALTSYRGSVSAAVTRAAVRDPRTTASGGGVAKGCVHGAAALQCFTTLGAPAVTQAGQACKPYHALPPQTAAGLWSGSPSTLGEGAAAVAVPITTTRALTMSMGTVQHHGRTHVNALREVVHHLVELAVCDPEPLIRKCALESLSPETYPLLYPHEPFVHQLFVVLWDGYMPNRSKAAQLLCALAPLNPPSIFPRLRQVLIQYTDDLTSSIARLAAPSTRAKPAVAPLQTTPSGSIHEDALFVLSQVSSRMKQSTHLYLPQLLSIVSSVLRSASSPRGSVLRALHFLVALREDSTEEQSALFAPFFDLVAQQLIDSDGDTARLLATVAALQSLLQQFTGSARCSSQILPKVVEYLHSLLYRKPSVMKEFTMAVLQLLGTISGIEPWDADAAPRAPALLRRPQNRYALPPLSSSTGVLGCGRAARSQWLDRDERADSAAEALAQLQKADRFAPFTAQVWCDAVLRALLCTVSAYVNGTMSQTQGGLCACLATIMNILTNTVAIHHLELYLPTVLTLVIDLLEKQQTRSRDIETAYGLPAHKPHSSIATATDRGEGAATAVWLTEAAKISDSSEAIRLLFLRSLFDLVLVAGRRIGPMYPLLNVFLRRSWKTMSPRGLVQCCEVLDALCWAVPDLLRDDCDVWIPSLLEALIQYDTLVVTHRHAHEGPPDNAPAAANALNGAMGTSTAAGAAVTPTEGGEEAPAALANTSQNFSASASCTNPVRHGSVATDANDSTSPLKRPLTPPPLLHNAVAVNGDESAPWGQQLKLVYRALTLCLTSLQPLVPPLAKRLVALSLSECLKSSHVPRREAVRHTAAPTATAAPTDSRTGQCSGLDAEHSATLAASTFSSLHSFWPATGITPASGVFDLMADPHEELISFVNACVCTPLLEYMVHSNLSTISMKLVKNLLARLESLSAVHEEALLRLWGAMGRHSASLLSQTDGSSGLSGLPDLTSGTAACPDGGVCSLAAPARAQLEVKLREVREQLHVQRARQHEEDSGSANISGCSAGVFPSLTAFYAVPRSASEALWFNNAALSRMWVQSADRAVTVRRYFPFDAVHTSWETEGEVQLLGCLLVSAAWHHPPSTTAFATTLHTYFVQRFGPDSVAVAYVRCICSSYYDLCMPLTSEHGEGMAVKWALQQQQQQRVAITSSGSDVGTESDNSPTAATQSTMMSGPGLYNALGQVTQAGSTDAILRHLCSPLAQTAAAMTPGEMSAATPPSGGAMLSGSFGIGRRRVVSSENIPALTIGEERGALMPSVAAMAFAGASRTHVTVRGTQSSSAAALPGSIPTNTFTSCGDNSINIALGRPMTAYPSMDRLDSSSDGPRSAEMNTTVGFSDHDEDPDGNGRMWTYSHSRRLTRSSNGSTMPHWPHASYQPQPQPQYPLPIGTASSTPFCGPNSLPRTVTARSTSGADTSPLTSHDPSPMTITLPIPVEMGGGGASFDNYVNTSVPAGAPALRSGSGSGSSFYPGSFFASAVVAEGRASGDDSRHSDVMNSSPHRHHPHASLDAGGGGSSVDMEVAYWRGSNEAMPPTHTPVGSGTGVKLTTPIYRYFQLPHPQSFPAGQSYYPHPISSGTSPSVTLGQQPAASPSASAGMLTVGSFTAASIGHRRSLLGLSASVFGSAGGAGGGASGAAGGPGGMPPRWRFASIAESVSTNDRASPNSSTMPPSAGGGGAGAALHPFAVLSSDAPAVPPPPPKPKPLSPLFLEAGGTSAVALPVATGAARSTPTMARHPPPLNTEVCFTATAQSSSATTHMSRDAPTYPFAEAVSDKVRKEATAAATSPCVASGMSEACVAIASAHEAGEVAHHNSLIAYFELHRYLSGHEWRSWWEQFCLYMLQCSSDYCIQACEPFAREHHTALYSELLPLALLSTLPSCTVAELVGWLRALRDFYAFHTDPRAPVPQQVATGVARMAHDLRLYHPTFFPPGVVSRVVDVWLPDSVVAELANRSLNPPLRILYLEQDLARSFSWGCAALLMVSADDLASAAEQTLFVQDPRFQRWLSEVAATTSESRSRGTAAVGLPGRRHHSCKTARSAAAVAKSPLSSAIDILPPSALELLGFHRAAALQYVRLYEEQQTSEHCDSHRGAVAKGDEATEGTPALASKGMATRHHSSAAAAGLIVGAMRCHICLFDFEAVLRLWDAAKGKGAADTATSMTSSPPPVVACGEGSDGDSGSAVVRDGAKRISSCVLSSMTAQYAVMSAQALSRWDYVQEAAYYAFGRGSGGGLPWPTGAPQAAQGHRHKSCGSAAHSGVTARDQRPPQPPGSPRGWSEDVGEEGHPQGSPDDSLLFDLPSAPGGTVALRAADYARESLLQRQMEVFVGAALVAAHDYDGARRALAAVRDGLRDSYAVFHTDNDRVKLEWSSIFQQLSDLEEGMHALEQVPAAQEGMATVSASSETGNTSAAWPGSGSPALDREINGKLFPEATVRRLRNIACRPVSDTTTILQRFMIIAVRSAIAPVTWQLDNVLALGERLEKAGQPMRAVQVLHHYASLPTVAMSFTTAAVEFKQQLNLEMLRRLIRNLPGEKDLREVYACVQTVLRHDLWLTRRAAMRRVSVVPPTSPFLASWCATDAFLSPLRTQLEMDSAMLTVPELGASLTHYQVDLLLLNMACRRRLAQVLLHRAQLTHRPSLATVNSATSDTVWHSTNTLAFPIGVGRPPRCNKVDIIESEKVVDMEFHSPASLSMTPKLSDFPATAAPSLSDRSGSASAAATDRTSDNASCPHDSAESPCVGRRGTSQVRERRAKSVEAATTPMEEAAEKEESYLLPESLAGRTALVAEYYLLEHAVAVTHYVPSVWREFGLVLFDICVAIHAEWKSTGDEETKQNFLMQSAKAIHGLQFAAQLWRSRSESVFSRGIGPFPSTMLRRHGHARTALPSTHLLLKALHLAVMCEVIVQDDARAAAASAKAATNVAAKTAVVPSSLSLFSLPPPSSATRSFSMSAGSTTVKDAAEGKAEDGTGGDGGGTISSSTTAWSLSTSQRTEKLQAGICDAEGMDTETSRDLRAAKKSFNTSERSSPELTAQPQSTAAVAVTQQQQGGFACLDFSAASYVQWAAVSPFLLAAATHHRSLYEAVRDMCVQSRDMLRQLVFPLIAMFEHGCEAMFAQQVGQPCSDRVTTNEEAPARTVAMTTVSRRLPCAFAGSVSEGQEGERQEQWGGFNASSRVLESESDDKRVSGVGCTTFTDAFTDASSLMDHPGEARSDASDAGLIAMRAASTSAMDVADRRHKGRRRVVGRALSTPLLPLHPATPDADTTPLGGPTPSYRALASASHHLASPLVRPLEVEERMVHSSLLADAAAASPGHRRLIQEALQMRNFVQGSWEVLTATPRRRSSMGTGPGQDSADALWTSLGAAEGAPPSTQRAREEASDGGTLHRTASYKGAASGFITIDGTTGTHGEMELLLDGFCPLPVPLWLLPSVFGVGLMSGDTGGSSTHNNTSRGEGVSDGKVYSSGVSAGPDAAARGRPHSGQSAELNAPAAAAPVTQTAGYRGMQGVDGSSGEAALPRSSATGLPASAATAHGQRAARSTATFAVSFAPATVPTIMYARRYAVPQPAPHCPYEEVIFVVLSDGLVCRFRHAAPATITKTGEVPECDTSCDAAELAGVPLGQLGRSGAASTDAAANDVLTPSAHTEAGRYVLPDALMEQVASLLLSHLPLTHLQRPFVLPLAVQDCMTMLPEHGTLPLILGAATAAAVRSNDPQGWRHDMALLLAQPSDATRTPPSLYHLMDDYTVHLRVREMALAAQEAAEAYPALDIDAIRIAAETGRRPGVSADSAYPFNWAYGYPVSAPPTDEAASALTSSHTYCDLVQRRRLNEERFDQLVAAAYDDGCVGPLIVFLQDMLAARPPPPPPPAPAAQTEEVSQSITSAGTAATTTSAFSASSLAPAPQPLRSPEETFSLQQRLYAYAAMLPRPEAYLRSLLAAVLAAVAVSEDTLTNTSLPPSPSSPLSPAGVSVFNQKQHHCGHRLAGTATPATHVSARGLQECRLALFRLESARCRLALNDAFSADSSNASHWLEARRTYAKELSEWSVIEYLLDIHTRECGTVLVNTYNGHVAVHALGRYCLQPPPRQSRVVCAKQAPTYAAHIAPLVTSPFPTHDATLFRLTPVLVAGLPLQSPHAAFQYHASSVLYEIFQYVRDLTGISTYGVDPVTALAHAVPSSPSHTSSTGASLSPCISTDFSTTASGDFSAALPSHYAGLRPESGSACASGSANAGVTTEGAAKRSAATTLRRANAKAAVAPESKQHEAPPPLESLVRVPTTAASTAPSSAFGVSPVRGAAQLRPTSPLGDAADAVTLPPPPHCFDSSSFRLKLSYDALLILHEESERSGRVAMLSLLRTQREATQAEWLRMAPATPYQDRDKGNAVEAAIPAASHDAVGEGTERIPASAAFNTGDCNDDDDDSAPRLGSAFELVATMIAAATDEEHLLGVDSVCPHTWQRWAPQW